MPGGGGQKDHGQGIYQGGRKEDKGHRHAGECPVCTDSLGSREAVDRQALRDHDRLGALQEIQDETVCHERGGEGQESGHRGE